MSRGLLDRSVVDAWIALSPEGRRQFDPDFAIVLRRALALTDGVADNTRPPLA